MVDLRNAVSHARMSWQSTHGKCSMCDAGDRPSQGGLHRGKYACPNTITCVGCRGCLPPGEICRSCFRKNIYDYDC